MYSLDDDGEARRYCDYPNCKNLATSYEGANDRKLDVCDKHKDIAEFIVELIKLRFM